jgi:hypothetical protein
MRDTLAGSASSSRAPDRGRILEKTSPPALDGQVDQPACRRCGTRFTPREGSGGSPQKYCKDECRKISNRERQRSNRRTAYAGPTTPSPSGTASSKQTPIGEPAVAALDPWESGTLNISGCERTEFVVALQNGETAGMRMETWPAEVRALMEHHVNRWVEENKEARTVRAITVAAPKYDGSQSCVVILHHTPKHEARGNPSERRIPDGGLS